MEDGSDWWSLWVWLVLGGVAFWWTRPVSGQSSKVGGACGDSRLLEVWPTSGRGLRECPGIVGVALCVM